MNRNADLIRTGKLCHEKAQANADWGQKGALVLLSSQHEDGEDQHCSEEHFNEKAADD